MTNKEEQILKEIIKYYQDNKAMPTIRYLQEKLHYRSTRSIYLYLKSLENQKYLIRNTANKLIINKVGFYYTKGLKEIKIINSKETLSLYLDKNKEYMGYILKNNYFQNNYLLKGDILIIEKTTKIKNNDLGLFIIDKKYRIMKYLYQDGFYLLTDQEQIILNRVQLLGKVIMIERKLN